MAAGPQLGALGATFKVARMLQAACLIAIIGMVANFISEMVQESTTPPKVLVATLSIVCCNQSNSIRPSTNEILRLALQSFIAPQLSSSMSTFYFPSSSAPVRMLRL